MNPAVRRSILLAALLAGCGDDGGSPSAVRGAVVELSDPIFAGETLDTFDLAMDPADWAAIVQNPYDDTFRRAVMTWRSETLADVGVRASGVTTRRPGDPKPSLRLDFDSFVPGREWRGLEQIRLDGFFRDETYLRDRLAYYVHRSAGLVAPRCAHARVVVNGSYVGLYGVEETVRKEILTRGWGENDGKFYELRHTQSTEPDPYQWHGSDPALYVPYPFEPKTSATGSDHDEIVRMLDLFNNAPLAEVRARLDAEVLDVGAFLAYLAGLQLLADYDGITASWGANNHYWYKPSASHRLVLIPWDPEFSLGLFGRAPTTSLFAGMSRTSAARWVELDGPTRALFLERVGALLDGPFAELPGLVDVWYAQIRDAVHSEPHRHKPLADFDAGPGRLKQWMRDRTAYVRSQLGAP
ncbi:MAG TPA: CotH kinase family protein [Planctomycetota bacterium]|nr:CotH kinase family protein [Planctomycetota bacterium]